MPAQSNRQPSSTAKARPIRSVFLVEGSVVQAAGVPACEADAAPGEEGGHHPALVGVRNLQGAVGHRNQDQVEVFDRAVASSVVVVDVVLVLAAGAALLQDGTEALDRGLVRKLEDDWQDWEGP